MDSQTAIAVQSLLESQNVAETPAAQEDDESDVFQCGKCKKQFNSLPMFVSHKQTHGTPPVEPLVTLQSSAAQTATAASVTQNHAASLPTLSYVVSESQALKQNGSALVSLPAFTSIPQSPLSQNFGQNVVLSDELNISFSNTSSNSFLSTSSKAPLTSPTPSSLSPMLASSSILPAPTSLSSTQGYPVSIITSVVSPAQQVANNDVMTPQFIIATSLPEGTLNSRDIYSTLMKPEKQTERRIETIQLDKASVGDVQAPSAIVPSAPVVNKQRRTKLHRTAMYTQPNPEKRKLKCHYCEKAFIKNFDLQQHMRSHTGEKPFQCIVCGRAFAQKSNVKKHMSTHKVWPAGLARTLPDKPTAVVTLGSEETPPTKEMPEETDAAIKPVISVDNTFVCQYCGSKFKTFFLLKSHMVQHKAEQVYKCVLKDCSETFRELDSFLEHTKTHENELTYRCHMCNKVFASLYELGVHQYSHSLYPNQGPKTSPKHFKCSLCGMKYASPEALHHHMQTDQHKYECPVCNKVFPCERYLRRHLPLHATVGQYECEVCSKRFKTEAYLKAHLLIHNEERSFTCEVCGAKFNRKDQLTRHKLTHDPVKKFKCPFKEHMGCTKEFNRRDKLKAHIITHTGIRPFKCDVCGKFFSRKNNLAEHKRLHEQNYRYSCNKCGRKFQRWYLMNNHGCHGKNDDNEEGEEKNEEKPEEEEEVDDPTKTPYLRNRRKIVKPRKRLISIEPSPVKRRGRPKRNARRDVTAVKTDKTKEVKNPQPLDPAANKQWQIVITEENVNSNDAEVMAPTSTPVLDGGQIVIADNGEVAPYCVLQPYVAQDPGQLSNGQLEVTLQPGATASDILAASAHAIELEGSAETLTYDQTLAYAQLQVADQTCLPNGTLVAMSEAGGHAIVVDSTGVIDEQQMATLVNAQTGDKIQKLVIGELKVEETAKDCSADKTDRDPSC